MTSFCSHGPSQVCYKCSVVEASKLKRGVGQGRKKRKYHGKELAAAFDKLRHSERWMADVTN